MTKLVIKAVEFVVWNPNGNTRAFFTHSCINIPSQILAKAIGIGAKRPDPQKILQLVDALDSILESSIAVGILFKMPSVIGGATNAVGVGWDVRSRGAQGGDGRV